MPQHHEVIPCFTRGGAEQRAHVSELDAPIRPQARVLHVFEEALHKQIPGDLVSGFERGLDDAECIPNGA